MAAVEITPSDDASREKPRAPNAAPKAPQRTQPESRKSRLRIALILLAGTLLLGGGGGGYWWWQHLHALPPWIARANGRLEAEQVEIATKYPGRIATVLAREGDMVDRGQVLARMDTVELEAQLRTAQAQVDRAQHQVAEAEAQIVQRQSERVFAAQELQRTSALVQKGWSTREQLDQRANQMRTAQAAYDSAVAGLNAAKAMIDSWQAEASRIKAQIDDSTLVAPARGRIEYKLSEPGEVLPAGGRVLTLIDLSDVYMTVFLPSAAAGRLTIGDEARITLDPVPGYVFPAKVTFVATEAQFTPKAVETAEEREKLMFRVKLSVPAELRTRYENQVKTGLRGVGYVRTDPHAAWPDSLAVKLL